eukprot:c7299_g1_i2.p1 GENE.c7299_g1_i2~~c7299_g1_i2.p1  ORF type:complete len:198 (-),score=31.52 c7299_g1_i2:254-847(-)
MNSHSAASQSEKPNSRHSSPSSNVKVHYSSQYQPLAECALTPSSIPSFPPVYSISSESSVSPVIALTQLRRAPSRSLLAQSDVSVISAFITTVQIAVTYSTVSPNSSVFDMTTQSTSPATNIREFIWNIIRLSHCESECVVIAGLLLMDFETASEITLCERNAHRLVLTALTIAVKLHSDEVKLVSEMKCNEIPIQT